MQIQYQLEIAAPPAAIYPFLYEDKRIPEWQPQLVARRWLKGQPNSPGATAEWLTEMEGRRSFLKEEIIVAEPNLLYKVRHSNPLMDTEIEFRLLPIDSTRTQLQVVAQTRTKGLAAKLLYWFTKKIHQTQLENQLQRLKALCEQQTVA
jgi:hypothetical protein